MCPMKLMDIKNMHNIKIYHSINSVKIDIITYSSNLKLVFGPSSNTVARSVVSSSLAFVETSSGIITLL